MSPVPAVPKVSPAVPKISHADLHTRVQPACSPSKPACSVPKAAHFPAAFPPVSPEFVLMRSRMNLLVRHGRIESFDALFPEGFLPVEDDEVTATIYSGNEEVLIVFISRRRTSGCTESVVNGRTVFAASSHSRRVLVTADGSAFPEIDGEIKMTAKKYVRAAGQVMEARAKAKTAAKGLYQ